MLPQDCALVIEVMSPGSVTTDQNDKPAKYAAARIAHFWRVEHAPAKNALSVFCYREGYSGGRVEVQSDYG